MVRVVWLAVLASVACSTNDGDAPQGESPANSSDVLEDDDVAGDDTANDDTASDDTTDDGDEPNPPADDDTASDDAADDDLPDDDTANDDLPDDTASDDAADDDLPDDDTTSDDVPDDDLPDDDTASDDTGDDDPDDDTNDDAPDDDVLGETLSDRYPGDLGIAEDAAVLFSEDFESGWGRWNGPMQDTDYLHLEADPMRAYGGSGYLRSTVTSAHLEVQEYISSQAWVEFERSSLFFARFYVQFVGTAPTPHHWVRVTAGTPDYSGSGRANTVPPGDQGFWFDFDASTDDVFNFYVYWYQMRSGRCNDGTTEPGCEGDQGSTYHYGNVFRPPEQTSFPRDAWFCVELRAQANQVGQQDGELQFWIDGQPVGEYRPGYPDGTWLRDSFHTGGCDFSACTEPVPFEGFDFRSSDQVLFQAFHLDAYYERGTSQDRRDTLAGRGIDVDDAQTILYDDVIVATERIGCKR